MNDETRSGDLHNGKVEKSGGRSTGSNKVGLRDRLKHFTWPWFLMTMGTGGLALVLAQEPHRFRGLYTIGLIVFILDLFLFCTFTLLILTRFLLTPKRFLHSFLNPTEMFFFASFFLSIATIIGNIQVYGIRGSHTRGPAWPWLTDCIHVLYWIYASCVLPESLLQYWIYIRKLYKRPVPMTPAWLLSGYTVMLTGTIAALVAESQIDERRLSIIVSCVLYQGFGWTFSYMLIAISLLRMFEAGLPQPAQRPALFIPICAPAYTITALLGVSRSLPRDYGYFAAHPSAVEALQAVALFVSIFLWLFALWWFAFAALSCVVCIPKMGFSMSWWGMIFPNVGFTIATVYIGEELGSQGVLWVATAMTILLVVAWLGCCAATAWAVWRRRVLFPGMDEDKED